MIFCVALGLLGYLLSGYSVATFEDVSASPEYSTLINTTHTTTEDMNLYGANEDRTYTKIIKLYYIVPNPGYKNRFVLSENTLMKGSILTIKKVRKSVSNWLDEKPRLQYLVDIEPYFKNDGKPIYIDSDDFDANTVQNK